jgi:hypothetical protein
MNYSVFVISEIVGVLTNRATTREANSPLREDPKTTTNGLIPGWAGPSPAEGSTEYPGRTHWPSLKVQRHVPNKSPRRDREGGAWPSYTERRLEKNDLV